MPRPIGIDLGTTFSLVATVENGRPTIVPNAEGRDLTPSVVAFTGDGAPLVGEAAKLHALDHPEETVFSIKRRMGSGYRVNAAGNGYAPEEVSSLILQKIKGDAEKYLGERIGQAVITVPAYFNDRQRQATRKAGILAGLEVMRIINEPTAAALAYGFDREDVHTILVWDLGGGTFDISILELGDGIFEVRSVSGDSRLGGDDVDRRIADRLAGECQRIYGRDLSADAVALQSLREAAEAAKKELSVSSLASVRVPLRNPSRGDELRFDVTREEVESLCADLLDRMVTPTRQALSDAGLAPEEIDRVVLVGGATRMPAVRQLARSELGQEPYRHVDPDRAVAHGAAIHAAMLMGHLKKVVLLDVLPLSLGIETQGGLMARIIGRNTPLPASDAHIFSTAADYQTSMEIHVLQGERSLAADNVSLGRFELAGIPRAVRGVPKVEVAFEADVDGIVHVRATDLLAENELQVRVASTKQLDNREIDRLADEARRNARRDRETRERIEAGIGAESVLAAAQLALSELVGVEAEAPAQRIAEMAATVREAVASGTPDSVKAASAALRRALAHAK